MPRSGTLLTHVYGSWEALAFSQDGESVCEVSNVVLMWNVLSLDWLVTLYYRIRIRYRQESVSFQEILTLSGVVGSNLATP